MAWSTPRTWTTDEIVTKTMMDTDVRDNMNYLLSGRPTDDSSVLTATTDYSFTGAGTNVFFDVDATNLILTVTLNSTRFFCYAFLDMRVSAGTANLDIINNSTTRIGDATNGLVINGTATLTRFTLFGLFTGLTPGVNTFKTQAKQSSTANTIIISKKTNGANWGTIQFGGFEI